MLLLMLTVALTGVFGSATEGAPTLPGWFAPVIVFISLGLLALGVFLWWKMTKASYKYKLPSYKNK